MNIAITGHTAGIGKSFTTSLEARGHDIVGLSKREGNNIRVAHKVAEKIIPCDMFINNAQAGYSQTELLYMVWRSWQHKPNKIIWVISTMLTTSPTNPQVDNIDDIALNEYRNQKIALEDAFWQLKYRLGSPVMCLIKPGNIATNNVKQAGIDSCDVDLWCQQIINTWTACSQNKISVDELGLGFMYDNTPLEL